MSFDISKFRSAGLKSSGARPNLFECSLTNVPPGVSSLGLTNFNFMCKGVSGIPSSTLGTIVVPYFGRNVKIPGNRTFDNLSVTVINDEDFKIRNAIEQWMNNLNSHQSNKSAITTAGQSGNLSGEMAIQHFDRAGNAISGAKWSFTNVYPVALGEIALDWGSNDTIEEFTIDFAYDYWTHGQNTPNL